MLSNITIGQYFPTGSVVHRLDAANKIVLTVAALVAIFIADSPIMLGICLVAAVALMLLTRVKVGMYLKMLKAIWPVVLLTSVLNLFYATGNVLAKWWIFTITDTGIYRSVFIAVRICLLIIISSALTYTTSPTELTDGIERLLKPLKFIGLGEAVHILAMMTSIALRFIPILIDETEKIMSAQKARGADMEEGGLISRVKAMLPVLIPLLISATRRACELAEAMECRCSHGAQGRTKMKQARFAARDFVALAIVTVFLAAMTVGRVLL